MSDYHDDPAEYDESYNLDDESGHGPLIIPRSEHCISRNNIDPDALKVLYRLNRSGYLAFLVGGAVRDLLLGRTPKDFDIVTDAPPKTVRRLFRNSRVIGRRFRLVEVLFAGGKTIEVSTFRRPADLDSLEDKDVLPEDNLFGSPADDAFRRDITINALFYDIEDFAIVDYVGGMDDLEAGIVRAVGDPAVRFPEDPVRVLRAVRHAARQGFRLSPETRSAVEMYRDDLLRCPPSRIRDELLRDLYSGASAVWFDLAHRTKVLYSLFPVLESHCALRDSPVRRVMRGILVRIDNAINSGVKISLALMLAAFFYPAFEERTRAMVFPVGRAGRAAWNTYVRETFPILADGVQLGKGVLDHSGQIIAILGLLRDNRPGQKPSPKTLARPECSEARALAELLGVEIAENRQSKDGSGAGYDQPVRRRRRPRRPARPTTDGGN